jgi:hypothetical protein
MKVPHFWTKWIQYVHNKYFEYVVYTNIFRSEPLDWKWFIQKKIKLVGNLICFYYFLATKCHNRVLSSSSFHWNILGLILCNTIRLHHLQLIIFLQCCELDAFQEICETLENDGVPLNFIEWPCALEHSRVKVTGVKETICTTTFQGDHAH